MEKFKELKDKRGTREYDMWFLKYTFADKDKPKLKQKRTIKKRVKQIKLKEKSSEFF
jgi:hypothetical protein